MPLPRRLAYAGLALACTQVVLSVLLPGESRGRIRLAVGGAAALALLLGLGRREPVARSPSPDRPAPRADEPAAHIVAAGHAPVNTAVPTPAVAAAEIVAASGEASVDAPADGPADAPADTPVVSARRRAPTLAVLLARGADF